MKKKAKKIGIAFLLFIFGTNIYAQRNIEHPLIVADTMQYLVMEYPIDMPWLIASLVVSSTINQEKANNDGFFMHFTTDSTHIVHQYVSKKKDYSLYEQFNPLSNMETSEIFTINAKGRKKQKEQTTEMISYVYKKLEQHFVVSISTLGKGIYVCSFFKP